MPADRLRLERQETRPGQSEHSPGLSLDTATGKKYAFIFSEIPRLHGQINLELPMILAVISQKHA